MALQYLFDDASRIMTVISFATFSGILAWTFLRKEKDFAQAAALPFADADADIKLEEHHV
ncbi:CcoQ/FixQ family Cbb3-type cytochrome c oxidase assembly chaperone [Massilia norwichensis]|jgi:cytochrome c oxidase cbb3-type subunit IV|uniref:CcoQ/FixQ family Cbb3-type cytochrome c oxidase assembly chaperone n=1 Tax=Massilia norwichensis TaxID=1442366 RepID=A0ABT2A129_9BURK|nr:CcoQ/FixQ family Cbb3-type cytochrome c oxidase assembly chaperone [Massilia norwichensis]MCS0587845.1 CcoQ/FixQ family Cbb3-type cytochrome c oxidase assembly chaperone [Massilia norwichensis]